MILAALLALASVASAEEPRPLQAALDELRLGQLWGRNRGVEAYDVSFYRPSPRVEAGVGIGKTSEWQGSQRLYKSWDAHAFVRVDLSRRRRPEPPAPAIVFRRTNIRTGSLPARVRITEREIPLAFPPKL